VVALFLRLRLAQFSHAMRRRPEQLLGFVLLLGIGLVLTSFVIDAFTALPSQALSDAATRGVLTGSVITFAFFVVPLLASADDIADPRVFGPLGLKPGVVASGLALSGLLSVPSVLLAVVAFAHFLAWSARPGTTLVAALSAVAIVATAVLGARLTRSFGALFFSTRRMREMAGLLGVLALVTAVPFVLALGLGGRASGAADRVVEIARGLGDSPLGLAWAAPADAAAGDLEGAWGKLGLTVVFLAVLWALWYAVVWRMLRSRAAMDPALEVGSRGLGWFDVFPRSEVGAIAARSVTYWVRDGRYKLALAVIPVVSIIVVIPFFVVGVWWQNLALVPLPVACLFLGWLLHNDLAHDSTALWLHVASNVSGWADRLGRALPVLLLGIIVIAIFAPLSVSSYGDWTVLPSMLGVCFALLLSGIGISSYFSARFPYAAVRPGASPFAQPQSSASSAGQAFSFALIIIAALPAMALGALELAEGGDWGLLSLAVGVGFGLLVLVLGVWLGARVFARQAPELLAFTLRN
jgi:ABC-2 type transport system permease protein